MLRGLHLGIHSRSMIGFWNLILIIIALIFYIVIGRWTSCFISIISQKALWKACNEQLFKKEKSGEKLLPCKCWMCKAARSLKFDQIAKSDIEDFSKDHPRWLKWLQIAMIILWPLCIILLFVILGCGFIWRLLLLPGQQFKEIRAWWN